MMYVSLCIYIYIYIYFYMYVNMYVYLNLYIYIIIEYLVHHVEIMGHPKPSCPKCHSVLHQGRTLKDHPSKGKPAGLCRKPSICHPVS